MVHLGRVLAMLAVLAHTSSVAADPSPWSAGVSEDQKAQAKILLDDGNALLLDKRYVEALDKYTAAVAAWDHPAIRFNMVRCLIQLGRNLEAHENLERALQYGAAPLEETVYAEALAYQKLLQSQVTELTVRCSQPGVQLSLDGVPLATCPLQMTRRVLAGPHQIVGTKQGLLPRTLELVAVGGKAQDVDVTLEPLEAGAVVVHRWPGYVPWTVFGGGFAVAGTGALVLLLARSQMRTYDQYVDANCAMSCTDADLAVVADEKSGAEFKNAFGMGLVMTGGAAVAAGTLMIYLNRGRTVYPEITPTAGGAAVSWSGRF